MSSPNFKAWTISASLFKIEKIVNECEKVLVLEDGYPFVEEQLKSFLDKSGKIKGRLDGTISRDGELNPDIVGKALGRPVKSRNANS